MPDLDELKKIIREKEWQKSESERPKEDTAADLSTVEKIVSKMKDKYKKEGLEYEELGGKLKHLRGEIAAERKIELSKVADLVAERQTAFVRFFGNIFLYFQGILNPLLEKLLSVSLVADLDHYLEAANISLTKKQFVALALAAGLVAGIIAGIASITLIVGLGIQFPIIIAAPLCGITFFVFGILVALLVPRQNARSRAILINKELPFALRHMAAQLRAGLGLYKTMQGIASSDYGVLSDEFAKTISQIEEGTETQQALKNLSGRTESKGLRKALGHIIRALKTGGNLSKLMEDIAAEVSFDLRIEMREFSEKMNFFGIIFIFIAIVFPVFIAILGGLRATPISNIFAALPLDEGMIALIYLVALPIIFITLLYYIKAITPKF